MTPQRSCATLWLCFQNVLIEDNSHEEMQTIASNVHGEMERQTRCVAQLVPWPACDAHRLPPNSDYVMVHVVSECACAAQMQELCGVPEAGSGERVPGRRRAARAFPSREEGTRPREQNPSHWGRLSGSPWGA